MKNFKSNLFQKAVILIAFALLVLLPSLTVAANATAGNEAKITAVKFADADVAVWSSVKERLIANGAMNDKGEIRVSYVLTDAWYTAIKNGWVVEGQQEQFSARIKKLHPVLAKGEWISEAEYLEIARKGMLIPDLSSSSDIVAEKTVPAPTPAPKVASAAEVKELEGQVKTLTGQIAGINRQIENAASNSKLAELVTALESANAKLTSIELKLSGYASSTDLVALNSKVAQLTASLNDPLTGLAARVDRLEHRMDDAEAAAAKPDGLARLLSGLAIVLILALAAWLFFGNRSTKEHEENTKFRKALEKGHIGDGVPMILNRLALVEGQAQALIEEAGKAHSFELSKSDIAKVKALGPDNKSCLVWVKIDEDKEEKPLRFHFVRTDMVRPEGAGVDPRANPWNVGKFLKNLNNAVQNERVVGCSVSDAEKEARKKQLAGTA